MDFKLDPVKVEEDGYTDKEMAVIGSSKGFCCEEIN
jgi:hypothetical protein